jgi:transposase-like protein
MFDKTQSTGDQVMTIVPMGNLSLQVPESGSTKFVLELVEQMKSKILHLVGRCLEESLETELDRFLGRQRYVRRRRAKPKESGVYCSRCRSHQRQDFHRNGHYPRQLALGWGRIQLQVPQAKCRCRGNVRLKFQTLRSGQRFWEDLQLEIQAEYGRGLSYRQIKVDLDERLASSVGLRTLNQRVLALGAEAGSFPGLKPGEVPPVVRVDGIWITVMFATGETKTDRMGRKRAVKRAQKVPILAAQGVWPATGRTQLLAWMRADGEDAASWQTFLEDLDAAGITPENGLKLLVADGGKGFRAAYENVYWQVPLQRCVFHKLRNLAQAIQVPAEWDRKAGHEFRTEFLRTAGRIWQAAEEVEARQLYRAFCETWQTQQAKAIRTLARDFEDTLAFYAVQEQAAQRSEHWPAHLLRTTSPLERMFREFRQRYRKAILFHSVTGLQAVTAQLAGRFS